jgi:hypothetical protein
MCHMSLRLAVHQDSQHWQQQLQQLRKLCLKLQHPSVLAARCRRYSLAAARDSTAWQLLLLSALGQQGCLLLQQQLLLLLRLHQICYKATL